MLQIGTEGSARSASDGRRHRALEMPSTARRRRPRQARRLGRQPELQPPVTDKCAVAVIVSSAAWTARPARYSAVTSRAPLNAADRSALGRHALAGPVAPSAVSASLDAARVDRSLPIASSTRGRSARSSALVRRPASCCRSPRPSVVGRDRQHAADLGRRRRGRQLISSVSPTGPWRIAANTMLGSRTSPAKLREPSTLAGSVEPGQGLAEQAGSRRRCAAARWAGHALRPTASAASSPKRSRSVAVDHPKPPRGAAGLPVDVPPALRRRLAQQYACRRAAPRAVGPRRRGSRSSRRSAPGSARGMAGAAAVRATRPTRHSNSSRRPPADWRRAG